MESVALSPLGTELLDDPAADPAIVGESLRNIARANRWFGGRLALHWALNRLLADQPRGTRLSLLDVGTGLGDLPRAAVRWGAARGLDIQPIGIERSRVAAQLARSAGVIAVLGCAGALPVRERSVDVVLVSQVAHHFAPGSVVELIRACDRVARLGVVIADLRRSPVAIAGFRLAGVLLGFDRVTLADGVTSIRRGYSADELELLLRRAGVATPVHRRPGFRLVAAWRPA